MHEDGRDHVFGKRIRQERTQLFGGGALLARGDDIGDDRYEAGDRPDGGTDADPAPNLPQCAELAGGVAGRQEPDFAGGVAIDC